MNRYFVKLLEDKNSIYLYADTVLEFEDKYLIIRNNEVIAMIYKNHIDFMHLDND